MGFCSEYDYSLLGLRIQIVSVRDVLFKQSFTVFPLKGLVLLQSQKKLFSKLASIFSTFVLSSLLWLSFCYLQINNKTKLQDNSGDCWGSNWVKGTSPLREPPRFNEVNWELNVSAPWLMILTFHTEGLFVCVIKYSWHKIYHLNQF